MRRKNSLHIVVVVVFLRIQVEHFLFNFIQLYTICCRTMLACRTRTSFVAYS